MTFDRQGIIAGRDAILNAIQATFAERVPNHIIQEMRARTIILHNDVMTFLDSVERISTSVGAEVDTYHAQRKTEAMNEHFPAPPSNVPPPVEQPPPEAPTVEQPRAPDAPRTPMETNE